ncbi:unnamed protein product [Pieris macdunnoughi]|uniref:Uncharacterized protein n=1 Tax=Pieris macdunnoughi TaxID=345717 RepID=A0A821XMU3_9NEOP|nr:unnamed protein product [Pieris macdunnoughi]
MNSILLVIFITITFISASESRFSNGRRHRRDVVGALDIVTNNVQPIHADVKNDQALSEKPCLKSLRNNRPARIEPGVVFKVTPPKDTFSLRRNFPLSSTLDLFRAISRLITVTVLAVSAGIEFYPVLQGFYETIHELIYFNKY